MRSIKVRGFFRKVGEWQLSNRLPLLAAIVAATALGAVGLPRLVTSTGAEDWFDDSDAIKRDTDRFQDIFGNEEGVAILVKSDDVFRPEVLTAIRDVGDELLRSVPYANRVTSLASLEISVGNDEGMEIVDPFGDGVPADPAEIERARGLILSRDSLRNRIVSDDCEETWVSLSLHAYPKGDELARGEIEPMYAVGAAARRILEDPRWKSDAYEFLPVGTPYTESEEMETVTREATIRVATGFVAMALCLALFLRSVRGLLVPVFTTVAGIAFVFGVMGWAGIKADATLMSLPVVLGMALSVGYSIHLVNAIKASLRTTGVRREAVIEAVSETGWPIFFTAATTIAGLVSFLFADIGPLRWLGLACSSVVFTVYVYVFTLVPVLMSFGKDAEPVAAPVGGDTPREAAGGSLFYRFGTALLRYRRSALAVTAVVIAAFVPGIGRTEVNMDYFEMMGMRIPYIQRLDEVVRSSLGSYLDYNVMITFPEADAAKDPSVMRRLDEFMGVVGRYDMTKKAGDTPKASSVLDIVKEMNRTLNGDDPAFYAVPDDPEMLSQLLFLYEISGGTGLSEWVSEDYSSLRAQFELAGYDANGVVRDIDRIKELGARLFPDAGIAVIGGAANYAEMNRKIVVGQLASFGAAFVIICAFMIVAFGSFKTGLIAMIPNVTPVIVIGGLMGYMGWSLDMLTMTVMPMILGIAVDDTIHFISRIKTEYERGYDYDESVRRSFRSIGSTMFMTTAILCAAFVMYTFSPMNTLYKIGMLATVGLASALVADYTLTPILISVTKPFGKRTDRKNAVESEVA